MNQKYYGLSLKTWAFILAISLGVGIIFGAASQLSIHTTGRIVNETIAAYSDAGATVPLANFEWGDLELGQTYTKDIYIKNQGNQAVVIEMDLSGLIPDTLLTYITVTWDYDDSPIMPDAVEYVIVSLEVGNTVPPFSDFEVDIDIAVV